MKLLCFTSAKGGVGTSFILSCTAFALAGMGKKCLVADMCTERRTLDLYMGTSDEFVFDMQDVVSGNCSFEDAVVSVRDGLDFISCPCEYHTLTDVLTKSGGGYDYILADCPWEYTVSQDFGVSETLLIVTNCDRASARCAEKLVYDITSDCEKYLVINNIIPELIEKGYHLNVDDICDLCGVAPIGLIPYEPLAVTGDAMLMSDTQSLNLSCAVGNMARRIEGESVSAISFDGKTHFSKLMKKYSRRND
jgi:septum formation inhibitor-activating ATPase MinD